MKQNLLSKEAYRKVYSAAGRELMVSNLYKHLANNLEELGYFGSAAFFKKESEEELKHYQIWADYVNDMGSWLRVPSVEAFDEEFESLMAVFQKYFDEELSLMEFYNEMYMDCEDATLKQQLLTFIEIQRKSVGEAGDFLATLHSCDDDKGALLLFDKKIK